MKLKDYIETIDTSLPGLYRVAVYYQNRGITEYIEDFFIDDAKITDFLEEEIRVSDQCWDGVFITIRKEI